MGDYWEPGKSGKTFAGLGWKEWVPTFYVQYLEGEHPEKDGTAGASVGVLGENSEQEKDQIKKEKKVRELMEPSLISQSPLDRGFCRLVIGWL